MGILLAVLLGLHGLIHLIGFVVPWQLVDLSAQGFVYQTTQLAGMLELGWFGVRVIGLLWFVAALGFVASAVGLALRQRWGESWLLGVTCLSLGLTLLGLPEAVFGVVVNLIMLACLALRARRVRLQPVKRG